METYVALLRAVNVSGTKRVTAADLRDFITALGFRDGRALLHSGNLIFRAPAQAPATIEQRLEREAAARLGLQTDIFVRTAGDLEALVARNPFTGEAANDPAHLVVAFLRDAPGAAAERALQAKIAGREAVRCDGRHAYVTYPDGIGESKLTNAVIEKALGTRGTARNWNTVGKLLAAARSS
jgi:uncharacterized protein (DUF1697 family)